MDEPMAAKKIDFSKNAAVFCFMEQMKIKTKKQLFGTRTKKISQEISVIITFYLYFE